MGCIFCEGHNAAALPSKIAIVILVRHLTAVFPASHVREPLQSGIWIYTWASNPMKQLLVMAAVLFLVLWQLFAATIEENRTENDNAISSAALKHEVAQFNLRDATLIEGLSQLSSEPISDLHLGVEELLRQNFSEPPDRSIRFSLSLEHKTVRDIIEALCQRDSRYTWSCDGSSINVYPQQIDGNPRYLLNRDLQQIALTNISDPYEALTVLEHLVPGEQLGDAGIGGDCRYSTPWSAVFGPLTVRQLMNRLAENLGARGGWIWSGSKDQRFFFFFRLGFHH
jgi:hypothetical protein